MRSLVSLLVAFAFLASVSADIPSHCLYNQILGNWRLDMNDNTADHSIVCSEDAFVATNSLHIRFALPNIVYNTSSIQIGDWTMVYDEGVSIRLWGEDQLIKTTYFAFFPYSVDPTTGQVTTFCNVTSISTYHDGLEESGQFPKNWGCFVGYKASYFEDAAAAPAPAPVTTYKPAPKAVSEDDIFVADHAFVSAINQAQSSWKAAVNTELVGQRVSDILRRSGRPVKRSPELVHQAPPKSAAPAASPVSPAPRRRRALNDIPVNFNWRNVSGTDFVGPMRDQLSCGSCYSFSTNEMIQARIRVLTDNEVTPFLSPQRVVSCSTYSQGCDGGFEYLVAKFGQDFGLTDEACFPYTSGILPDVSCSAQCANPHYYTVDDFNYVGGYYGNCSEDLMIQELLNGPIAVSFMVYDDFLHYRSGIYHHVNTSSATASAVGINPWEPVSHSVLLIGYGVDDTTGEKYWRVANSWGRHSTDYGGDFLIRRGTDECSIESAAVYAVPSLASVGF